MALSNQEKEAVSIVLGSIANRSVLDNAGPEGRVVAALVKYLQAFMNPVTSAVLNDATIAKLAIAYPLSPISTQRWPVTDAWTSSNCPVRGRLVSLNPNDPVDRALLSALNEDALTIALLSLAFVFPVDLAKVRQAWIEIGEQIFPNAGSLDSDADVMDLRVGLDKFCGLDDKGDCKGKTCPGVANVGCC